MLDDLRQSGRATPTIDVVVDSDGVLVVVNGSWVGPEYLDGDPEEDKAAIADYIQSQLMDGPIVGTFWPECAAHRAGLHAEVHDGAAVWWCQLGNHPLGAIGSLSE